ncbi:metal-dependent hydrolase [Pseudomonas zhanjiangensis]|uniref:Metal-dependent hydrolase n=1 Tax=Pseudomonas zhanjiangensis TaxID=3239015 RepID=A0ABV3YMK4_9PSED
MFIAHLPSGYLLTVALAKRLHQVPLPWLMSAGILGALAPDFDMAYFYLVDQRQTHHHQYPSHWPLCWLALCAAALIWRYLAPHSRGAVLAWLFGLGGILHLLLDSLVGDIWWLAPFIDQPYALFSVPALYQPWWLNFIVHWSFAVELAIAGCALLLYRRRSCPSRPASKH